MSAVCCRFYQPGDEEQIVTLTEGLHGAWFLWTGEKSSAGYLYKKVGFQVTCRFHVKALTVVCGALAGFKHAQAFAVPKGTLKQRLQFF